ncbi:DUF7587 domain-containing protein [Collimonas humicola]|uniref:DUF7587 domain-containing protein n=1 Tax=Collimonas humicola TaxID=2825886 RepID=UPI001B8CF6B0|nr:hypothetical protein [Collimonas humicola]
MMATPAFKNSTSLGKIEREAGEHSTRQQTVFDQERPIVGEASHEPRERSPGSANAPNTKRARTRKLHYLSEGDSESEDSQVLYRSVRKNEDPYRDGLQPPPDYNPDLSAAAHIRAGSSAKIKSPWISATRSLKTAAAWATTTPGGGRVVQFRNPNQTRETYDLTNSDDRRKVFGESGGGTAEGFAKGSQEVVIKGDVPADHIVKMYDAKKVTVKDYKNAKINPPEGMNKQVRGRVKVTASPVPVQLYEI